MVIFEIFHAHQEHLQNRPPCLPRTYVSPQVNEESKPPFTKGLELIFFFISKLVRPNSCTPGGRMWSCGRACGSDLWAGLFALEVGGGGRRWRSAAPLKIIRGVFL